MKVNYNVRKYMFGEAGPGPRARKIESTGPKIIKNTMDSYEFCAYWIKHRDHFRAVIGGKDLVPYSYIQVNISRQDIRIPAGSCCDLIESLNSALRYGRPILMTYCNQFRRFEDQIIEWLALNKVPPTMFLVMVSVLN